jgi:Tfp pilus assembly protein PilV
MRTPSTPSFKRARGATLLEALVAFLVLSLGMLTMARLQTTLRLNSDIARQRSEAVRLAEEDMEALRAFATLAATQGVKAYADIVSAKHSVTAGQGGGGNVDYEVAREVASVGDPGYKTASVTVNWADRHGAAQHVVIDSVIGAHSPTLSAALSVASRGQAVRGLLGRPASVPATAKNLGNGHSVLKPDSGQTLAFVFSNASGHLTSVCSGVTASSHDIVAADLVTCTATNGLLLSGQVRFSLTGAPDAAHANDTPLALAVSLALSGGPYAGPAQCGTDAMKTVAYPLGNTTRREAVPLLATPESWGVQSWTELGERFIAYHCVVVPAA